MPFVSFQLILLLLVVVLHSVVIARCNPSHFTLLFFFFLDFDAVNFVYLQQFIACTQNTVEAQAKEISLFFVCFHNCSASFAVNYLCFRAPLPDQINFPPARYSLWAENDGGNWSNAAVFLRATNRLAGHATQREHSIVHQHHHYPLL